MTEKKTKEESRHIKNNVTITNFIILFLISGLLFFLFKFLLKMSTKLMIFSLGLILIMGLIFIFKKVDSDEGFLWLILNSILVVIIIIIIVGVLIYNGYNSFTGNNPEIASNVKDTSSSLFSGIKEIAKNIVSKDSESTITNSNKYECPQLPFKFTKMFYNGDYSRTSTDIPIFTQSIDGWKLIDKIYCRYGSEEGESINNIYCGKSWTDAYVEKTFISNEGTIEKIVKIKIVNVYDDKGNFVKTICEKYS